MNRLIYALPAADRQRLTSSMTPVRLNNGAVIYDIGEEIQEVYFLDKGLISLVVTTETGESVEVASVGNEGLVGICRFYGHEFAMARAVVQAEGDGYKMEGPLFDREMLADDLLSTKVRQYAHVHLVQLAQSSVCHRLHSVEQRCARWLLSMSDRAPASDCVVTQEFLAAMLGVRRQTAAIVMAVLEEKGLIELGRKRIRIKSRTGLEDTACECYGIIKEHLERI